MGLFSKNVQLANALVPRKIGDLELSRFVSFSCPNKIIEGGSGAETCSPLNFCLSYVRGTYFANRARIGLEVFRFTIRGAQKTRKDMVVTMVPILLSLDHF